VFKDLPILKNLIQQLQRVPYLASKNIYKIAFYFLSKDEKTLENLCRSILEAKKKIKNCKTCFNWVESGDVCSICLSGRRDKNSICVVETWHDLIAIENTANYNGLYHILGGSLCPLEGIGPSQLTIDKFMDRLKNFSGEIILATNPTPEGEATASFISSKIDKNEKISVSRLASGIPIGSTLEFMDKVTIHKALSGRRPF